jgi:hypothetical protein
MPTKYLKKKKKATFMSHWNIFFLIKKNPHLQIVVVNKFSRRMRISIMVRDYKEYVHAVRNTTKIGHLESMVAETLIVFYATFYFILYVVAKK